MSVGLSIIIVSFNTREVTLQCVRSLHRHPPEIPFEVILIDNASNDGSADAVRRLFPEVRLVESKENLGFARGNNVAAAEARGKRLLLLNPDTIILPGSVAALWRFAERSPERGIWGGRTVFEDGSLNPTSCWAHITPWSLFCSAAGLTWLFRRSAIFNPEAYGSWARDHERDVDIVTGCFLMVERALWQRLGGFDPLFFMYAEEADLCLRAVKLGARPAVTPEAEIIHLGGRSETSMLEKTIKVARGRMTLIRKHWAPPRRTLGVALYALWALSRATAAILSGPEGGAKWRAIWRRRKEWLGGY